MITNAHIEELDKQEVAVDLDLYILDLWAWANDSTQEIELAAIMQWLQVNE